MSNKFYTVNRSKFLRPTPELKKKYFKTLEHHTPEHTNKLSDTLIVFTLVDLLKQLTLLNCHIRTLSSCHVATITKGACK
jgi:hypothetical protein